MAKGVKRGLGRGLNSLLGVYEPSQNLGKKEPDDSLSLAKNPAQDDSVQRDTADSHKEKTRFEEAWAPQPDINADETEDKKEGSQEEAVSEPFDSDSEEALTAMTDGVMIKGVVERAVRADDLNHSPEEPPSTSTDRLAQKQALKKSRFVSSQIAEENNEARDGLMEVELSQVEPNPDQPRIHFKAEELEELASSIEKDGLLQPILVRIKNKKYQIIAGERRWQASKKAGLKKVPIRIVEASDDRALELALIENLQRSDLNPIEEAYGYKRMMERGRKTQSEVAAAVSKGRSTVANALRLLELPEHAQELLYEEKITAGHARAILSVPTEDGRLKLTTKITDEKLSVRQAENIARLYAGKQKTGAQKSKSSLSPFFRAAARSMSSNFGTKVKVKSLRGKNKIEIEFKDEEELKRLLEKMSL